jgi:hypothetical protein
MEVFDKDNKFITSVFDPNATDISKINKQLIKDIVFVDSKNYKYNPSFTRIYYMSPDFKQTNVISIIDELEKEKMRLNDAEFVSGFYAYLMKEYNLPREAVDDAAQVVSNGPKKEEVIERLMSSYKINKQGVDEYFNLLPIQVDTRVSANDVDKWSEGTSSVPSPSASVGATSPSSSDGDIFELLTKKPVVDTKVTDNRFSVYIRYAYIILTKKNPLTNIKFDELFKNFQLDKNFIAVGLNLNGESKFRIAKTDDKDLKKKIRIFTNSESKVTQVKVLKIDTLYFMYYIDKGIYVSGELRSNSTLVLRIVFSEKYELKDIERLEELLRDSGVKILETFKKIIPNLLENPDWNFVKISIKMIHNSGTIDKQIIRRNFITNFKETHGGTIFRFDVKLDENITIKDVIYSEKDGYSNFSIKDIPNKNYIATAIKNINYPFINTDIKETEKKEVKKQSIKDLSSLGIPYDARKCQKDRRIEILKEGETGYTKDRTFNYKGNMLVCRSDQYPFPGETKTGIPCCFKKIQVKTQYTTAKAIDVLKTLNTRPLLKEKEELVAFRREGLRNVLLGDIFPVDEGFYALTLSDTNIGLVEILNMLYGSDVVEKAFSTLKTEDSDYFNIKDATKIEDIAKAVTLYKKINIFVISYTEDDFSFVCSMSQYLLFDTFIIVLLYKDNYKILVKSTDETRNIGWVFGKSNANLQRLIRSYNISCLGIADCSYTVPDLKKISMDAKVNIQYGIIDPVTNKVIYVETDMGIIPIKPSDIVYNVKTKFVSDISRLEYDDQLGKLAQLEKDYEYLKSSGKVYNEAKTNVTGIKTVCNFVVPVLPKLEMGTSDTDEIFDIDILNKLKETIMSGEELASFKSEFIDNYKEVVANTVKKYYNDNPDKRMVIINLIDDGNFEELLVNLKELFVIKDNIEIPIDNNTSFPIPIQNDQILEILTHLAWLLMNNSEEFFTDSILQDKTQIDVSMIPNLEEVEISAD